jgi:class 3 adenylate cyclase
VAPNVRFVKTSGVHIAYQVVGDGPIDLMLAYGNGSNIDVQWDYPRFAAFLDDLADLGRLILYDKRDTGLSDRTGSPPTLEQRVDDLRAVLDVVGSERPVVLGMTGGAAVAAMFAAMEPSRVESLVLYACVATYSRLTPFSGLVGVDTPSPEFLDAVQSTWGTGITAHLYARSMAREPGFVDWCARYERSMASPGNAPAMVWMSYQWDLTRVLPTISVPTLVLWRQDALDESTGVGREMGSSAALAEATYAAYEEVAELIPNARGVCLPGGDHWPWVGDTEPLLREIRQLLATSARQPASTAQLAAVLFTDIVSSTERAAELGDRRWRTLLDRHDAITRTHVERFHGTCVKHTGDGMLATFDGPTRAVRCALALVDAVRELGIEIRAGVHVGEIEPRGNDVGGIAVHIASRVCGEAARNEVYVTRTVRDLVAGSGLQMHIRGMYELKGVPEEWSLFAATA